MDLIKLLTGLVGTIVTLMIFVAGVIFQLGRHSARLQSLEKWRDNIRGDMHEISDKLEAMFATMRELKTLVEERTERRTRERP